MVKHSPACPSLLTLPRAPTCLQRLDADSVSTFISSICSARTWDPKPLARKVTLPRPAQQQLLGLPGTVVLTWQHACVPAGVHASGGVAGVRDVPRT